MSYARARERSASMWLRYSKAFVTFCLLSVLLIVYLFVSAPAPLPEANAASGPTVSVRALLEICAAENAAVRKLYTKQIVGPGKQNGLEFAEDWDQASVDAGPLPALFLRETAKSLERDPVPLGLFLGSDYPISKANLFKGQQAEAFKRLKADRKPRHFFTEDLELHTAMFPDLAVADACVDCHNKHPDTPKRDWKLNDVMGATTWTYPDAAVSLSEALRVVAALRRGFRAAYTAYVNKAQTFKSPPEIGGTWPTSGYYLPTPDEFMSRAENLVSVATMNRLLAVQEKQAPALP